MIHCGDDTIAPRFFLKRGNTNRYKSNYSNIMVNILTLDVLMNAQKICVRRKGVLIYLKIDDKVFYNNPNSVLILIKEK